MTDYGKPQRETMIANTSRDDTLTIEESSRRALLPRSLPRPAHNPPPPVIRNPPAADNAGPSALRRDLEARATVAVKRPAPPYRPQQYNDPPEGVGAGTVKPGGFKTR